MKHETNLMVKSPIFLCQILVLLYRMAPVPKNPEWLFSSPSYVVMPEKLVHQLAILIVILHFHFILLFF